MAHRYAKLPIRIANGHQKIPSRTKGDKLGAGLGFEPRIPPRGIMSLVNRQGNPPTKNPANEGLPGKLGARLGFEPRIPQGGIMSLVNRQGDPPTKNPANEVYRVNWVQGSDLNRGPSGYEPDELPDCSTLH